jgi:hypothetical protein
VPNSIKQYLGFFFFSLITTLIIYFVSNGRSVEAELNRDRELAEIKVPAALLNREPSPQAQLVSTQNLETNRSSTPAIPTAKKTAIGKDLQVGTIEASLTQNPKSGEIKSSPIQNQKSKIQNNVSQQGREILLNGRRLPVAWTQWDEKGTLRTGISDTGAMQSLGIELLNTNRSDVQPVFWFPTDPDRPISLQAKFIAPYRYIDVTDLMDRSGANMRVVAGTLNIDCPKPQILNVRQGNQTWGKRMVVDLDRPVFWQVSQAPKQGAVIIEGMATPDLLAQFKPTPANANVIQATDEDDLGSGSPSPRSKPDYRSFSLKSDGKVTKLLLDLPTANGIQVFSLTNPNRLVIDVRPDAIVQRQIAWTQGIVWRQQFVNLDRDYFPVNWLEIDPRSPGISIKPITTNRNTLEGTAPIVTTARSQQAIAAINGGFFNRNNKYPLGALRLDNRWLSSPILGRGAIAWNDKGQVKIGRLAFKEILTTSTGNRLPISYLNSGYVEAGMARYTPEWGRTYKTLSDNEAIALVQNNRVTQQLKAGRAGKDSFVIPADGYLLTARKNGSPALTVGTQVSLETATLPADFTSYPQVLGAGPLLVQNGQIVLNAASERFSKGFQKQMASRSAIATTSRGTIVIAAIHNRVGGRGATLAELARIMQRLGAIDALNLDGGSSTSLSLGGQLIDRSPVTAARVHNGIGVFMSSSL